MEDMGQTRYAQGTKLRYRLSRHRVMLHICSWSEI